jgi:hypothetical protein
MQIVRENTSKNRDRAMFLSVSSHYPGHRRRLNPLFASNVRAAMCANEITSHCGITGCLQISRRTLEHHRNIGLECSARRCDQLTSKEANPSGKDFNGCNPLALKLRPSIGGLCSTV